MGLGGEGGGSAEIVCGTEINGVEFLIPKQMLGTIGSCWGRGAQPLEKLHAAIREFQARGDRVDLKGLRVGIDVLEAEFAREARETQRSGDHLINGNTTAASWIARTCGMSITSASERVTVGTELESLPRVAKALNSGEISYQSTAVLCHLRD